MAFARRLLGVLLFIHVVAASLSPTQHCMVMPWLCLERCGSTEADIHRYIDKIAEKNRIRRTISTVAFERFNLGANASLISNNLTRVGHRLHKLNITTLAMVSSYPYPPQFLSWMRQVFNAADRFIDQLINATVAEGYSGVNIDWEPTAKATAQDASDYATFLGHLRSRLAAHRLITSVDVATWNAIWNLTEINAALTRPIAQQPSVPPPSYVFTMSTYTPSDQWWLKELDDAEAHIDNSILAVGLEAWPITKPHGTSAPAATYNPEIDYNATSAAFRFEELSRRGVTKVGIWRFGLMWEEYWWPLIEGFSMSCGGL